MTNLSYLAASVEAGRIASAERQFAPLPEKPRLFDLTPRHRVFEVRVSGSTILTTIPDSNTAGVQGFAYLRSVLLRSRTEGVGAIYIVYAAPWASEEDVADELESITLPF